MANFLETIISGPGLLDPNFFPQRKYNWELLMPNDFGGIFGVSVANMCQDISFGDYSMNQLSEMRYGAEQRFYAGLLSINKVKMTFIKSEQNEVYQYFYAWGQKIISPQGHYYPKKSYAKDVYVKLKSNSQYTTTQFKFKGAFPVTFPTLDLSYKSNEILEFTIELAVDKIEIS